jgi:hypothetical protein
MTCEKCGATLIIASELPLTTGEMNRKFVSGEGFNLKTWCICKNPKPALIKKVLSWKEYKEVKEGNFN